MVKILQPFKAASNDEMNVEEGQTFSVTEENNDMYRGPLGWFPKEVAVDVSMKTRNGPFEENSSGSKTKKRKTGRVVNFKVTTMMLIKLALSLNGCINFRLFVD